MARVTRGVTSHAKHKKVLKQAKGFYGRRKNTIRAAKAAGAIMGMNNVYYRTVHLSGIAEFKKMPARLGKIDDVALARGVYLQGLGFVEFLAEEYKPFRLRLL